MIFFFSSRRRHTRWPRDWSSDVCSSDLFLFPRDTGPETVEMPGVVSLSQDEARATLEEAGLEPDFTNEDSTEVEAVHVIMPDPPQGEDDEVGAAVRVVHTYGLDSMSVSDYLLV